MRILYVAVAFAVLIVAVPIVLGMETGQETVTHTYYTQEPLKYSEAFLGETTRVKWQIWWPPLVEVRQVQYRIKNSDALQGEFLVSVAFYNGQDHGYEQRRVTLEPGHVETVKIDSPIRGPQSINVQVTPPTKQVMHQREVQVSYTLHEKLKQLKDIGFLSGTE